jgi:anti-sigma factor RsiW
MTSHLSPAILNALADGELTAGQLADANEHLAACPSCTSSALYQSLLKSATAKAGARYTPSPHLQARLARLALAEASQHEMSPTRTRRVLEAQSASRFGPLGWATAAVLLLVSVNLMLIQRTTRRAEIASAENAALTNEVFDQHVATLADGLPPQVLSTDRHTVKPWFQGKIPFSFNLPESLPGGVTLDGANLTYLHNQPVAQLLYSIGRHRVSVFVRERSGVKEANELRAEHLGFHVMTAGAGDLEVVAVSDADPARVADLVRVIAQAQAGDEKQPK